MPVQIQHSKCTLLQSIRWSLVSPSEAAAEASAGHCVAIPEHLAHTYIVQHTAVTPQHVNKLSVSRWRGDAERAAPPRPSGTWLPEVCAVSTGGERFQHCNAWPECEALSCLMFDPFSQAMDKRKVPDRHHTWFWSAHLGLFRYARLFI